MAFKASATSSHKFNFRERAQSQRVDDEKVREGEKLLPSCFSSAKRNQHTEFKGWSPTPLLLVYVYRRLETSGKICLPEKKVYECRAMNEINGGNFRSRGNFLAESMKRMLKGKIQTFLRWKAFERDACIGQKRRERERREGLHHKSMYIELLLMASSR